LIFVYQKVACIGGGIAVKKRESEGKKQRFETKKREAR